MVFEEVCVDLESQGYEVQPILLPACAVGAPHRRDRVWFIAYSDSNSRRSADSNRQAEKQHIFSGPSRFSEERIVTNTCEIGFSSSKPIGKLGREQRFTFNYEQRIWEKFPTQSPICGGDDGLPTKLDGITFPKWRQESIKGYGNAIVPQVAYEIFKVIAEMDAREKAQLKLF
jgi:DNA (cytosine-5)-methyltransferase 1